METKKFPFSYLQMCMIINYNEEDVVNMNF